MTATTIKVSVATRDRLKAQAAAHGRTIGEHIEALLASAERQERFAEVRRRMEEQPPDNDYRAELQDWQGDRWT